MKLIIIILCFGFEFGGGVNKTRPRKPDFTCKENGHYLIRKGGDFFCVECADCPCGQELEEKCGVDQLYPDTIDIECIPCKKGFYKDVNDYSPCRPCDKCLNHFEVKSPCEDDHNTVCSRDSCESGYKFDPKLVQCIPSDDSTKMKTTTGADSLPPTDPLPPTPLSSPSQQDLTKIGKKCENRTWVIKCKDNKWLVEQIVEQISVKLKPVFFMFGFMSSFCVAVFVFFVYLVCMLRKKY